MKEKKEKEEALGNTSLRMGRATTI